MINITGMTKIYRLKELCFYPDRTFESKEIFASKNMDAAWKMRLDCQRSHQDKIYCIETEYMECK